MKRLRPYLLAGYFLVAVISLGAAKPVDSYLSGIFAFQAERYETARNHFKKAAVLTRDPLERHRINFLLGLSSYYLHAFQEALPYFKAAVGHIPFLDDYTHFYYGEALFWTRNYQTAYDQFKTIFTDHPKSDWWDRSRFRMADCLYGLGRSWEALANYQALYERYRAYPHRDLLLKIMTEIYLKSKNLKMAAVYVKKILTQFPHTESAEFAGKMRARLKQDHQIRIGLSNEERYLRASTLSKYRQWKKAAPEFEALFLTLPPSATGLKEKVTLSLANLYLDLREFEKAIPHYRQLITQSPVYRGNRYLKYRLAHCYLMSGDKKQAFKIYWDFYDKEPGNMDALFEIGKIYINAGEYAAAEAPFKTYLKKFKGGYLTLYAQKYLAWLAYRQGRYLEAISGFEALAKKMDPLHFKYWIARAYMKQGDFEAAKAHFNDIIEGQPHHYYGYQAQNRLLEIQNQAVDYLLDLQTRPVKLKKVLAQVHSQLKNPQNSVLEKALFENMARGISRLIKKAQLKEAEKRVLDAAAYRQTVQGQVDFYQKKAAGKFSFSQEDKEFNAIAQKYKKEFPGLARAYQFFRLGLLDLAKFELWRVLEEIRDIRNQVHYKKRKEYLEEDDGDGPWGIIQPLKEKKAAEKLAREFRESALFQKKQRAIADFGRSQFYKRLADIYELLHDYGHLKWQYHWKCKALGPIPRNGQALHLWQKCYPIAYPAAVLKYSRKLSLDPEMVWSLMAIESAFKPDVVSYAGAIGLMQIMRYTCHSIAANFQVPGVDYGNLYDPEASIYIGLVYLKELMKKFQNQFPLAAASYNCGPHRIADWLLAKGDRITLDEFVEEIPYNQAKNYVKELVKMMGYYRRIYRAEKSVPIPQRLDPQIENNIDW